MLPTTFRWPLDDVDDRFEKAAFGEAWDSPDFEVDGIPKATFFLKFFLKGKNEKFKEHCAMYLHVRDFGDHPSIRLKHDVRIENGGNKQLKKNGIEHKMIPTASSWGWPKMFAQTEFLDFSKSDSPIVFCKVTPLDPVDAAEWAERTAPLGVCRKMAANFDAAEFADVEVRVQGRVFPVVKFIICSGSPVFRRMFTLDTKEKETGVVELKKDEADMIELLLRFFYSGKVEGLKDVAARLLPVADCYEVLDLVEMCLASLVKNVSPPTVVRDLKLAFAHDHQGAFKRKLFAFAHENLKLVSQQPDWNLDFFRDNLEIAFEVTLAPTS